MGTLRFRVSGGRARGCLGGIIVAAAALGAGLLCTGAIALTRGHARVRLRGGGQASFDGLTAYLWAAGGVLGGLAFLAFALAMTLILTGKIENGRRDALLMRTARGLLFTGGASAFFAAIIELLG